MSVQQLLLDVLNCGVQIGVDGTDLTVRGAKGAITPELRERLAVAKSELIGFIGPNRRFARMSPAQRRMWFIDRMGSVDGLYAATAGRFRLRGTIGARRLEQAIREVVARHEIMRTSFPFVNGEPVQSIAADHRCALAMHDADDESDAFRIADAIGGESFDLANGPLFRPALIRIADDDHILVLSMHHIINDGWSLGVLFREINERYNDAALPDVPLQYADATELQYRVLESKAGAEQLAYWRDQLNGQLPVLNLAGDRPRPRTPTFTGKRCRTTLSAGLSESLRKTARAEGASLFMFGLAAYTILLHRYTRDEELIVGAPIAGRTAAGTENMLGLFVNTVAIRSTVDPSEPARAVLRRVRDASLGAFANQDVPFDDVVAEVQPGRDLTHSPLFRVMFVLQNAPRATKNFGDATTEVLEADPGTAKFDLSLELIEHDHGIRVNLEYSADLFDENSAQRMLGHYERLLESLCANPETPVAELGMTPAAEREQLAVIAGASECAFADTRPVHQRFADHAALNPDADAVLWPSGRISYAELDRAANAIAHRIQTACDFPPQVVAVCAPSSPEMVAGQLAAMKLGSAYLSLDPTHPFDRLAHMVRNADADVLLIMPEHAAQFPRLPTVELNLDTSANEAPPQTRRNADDTAYIIYTSGSTGAPKGVSVPHRGLANLAAWHQNAFGVTPNDRGSQLASPAFDASVWEIWPYLSAGAAVAICPDGVKSEPEAFRDWLLAERVTVAFAPTDLAERMFTLDWPAAVSLRYLLTGGARLMTRPGEKVPFQVANNYGPTENSVVTTSGIVEPTNDSFDLPTIGHAIANHAVFVLDESLRLTPWGVPGELCVGGLGLAHGYVNDDDNTERCFVEGPRGAAHPQRLYRTGDLVRLTSDGQLQFLGRIDGQLNVLGHRIEPTEIESAACGCARVSDAAVLPMDDGARASGLRLFVAGDGPDSEESPDAHIDRWQTLYDDTYSDTAATADPALNTIGWTSSYTGAPIPASEMREWRDETVKRLRALHPKRVLEIGCGTGMLLAQLAPECERYVGVDFSQPALDFVRSRIVAPRDLRHVSLHRAAAHEIDSLHEGPFDLVILNSIVQYFPSGEYLRRVLELAVDKIADCGTVFVGDVRDRSLMEAFHTDVHLANEPRQPSVNAIAKQIQTEEELLIDPLFFHGFERAGLVETLLKRGAAENELTKFRYDALLRIGTDRSVASNFETLAWGREVDTELSLLDRLNAGQHEGVRIIGVPNARVADALNRSCELNNAVPNVSSDTAIDPESFARSCESAGYTVTLALNTGEPGTFDALVTRTADVAYPFEADTTIDRPRFNEPLHAGRLRQLAAHVRDHIEKALPPYMMPNRIVPLASIPKTPSGKPDRRALAALDEGLVTNRPYTAPRNELEESVVHAWETLLGADRIGVHDNFFELGGHSLMATQFAAQMADAYNVELPLRAFFSDPTPAGAAGAIEDALMREIEDLSEDEAARLVAS